MKASKRRRRADRTSKPGLKPAPAQLTFSAEEEAFFREGAELCAEGSVVESFADLDAGFTRPSLWRRLFARRDHRATSARADA